MYLAVLSKEEKELFIGLAYNIAVSDGNYSDEEKRTILGYCQEMQMDFDQKVMIKPIDDIVERIKVVSNKTSKKIIIFEALGLAMSDGIYGEDERVIINNMEKDFEIEKGFINKCEAILKEYIEFQTNINHLILG